LRFVLVTSAYLNLQLPPSRHVSRPRPLSRCRIATRDTTTVLNTLKDVTSFVKAVTDPLGVVTRFTGLMKSVAGTVRSVSGFLDTATRLEEVVNKLVGQAFKAALEEVGGAGGRACGRACVRVRAHVCVDVREHACVGVLVVHV
jgi:hypothetical protein